MALMVLHQSGDWAIVLRDNDGYLIRHLICGSYLRFMKGCTCKAAWDKPIRKRKLVPVGEDILKMYVFLTEGK